MQSIITHIFETLGGASAIAHGTGFPVQTVHSWVKKEPVGIPPWRRADVLGFAQRAGLVSSLSDEAREYLTSSDRNFGRAA